LPNKKAGRTIDLYIQKKGVNMPTQNNRNTIRKLPLVAGEKELQKFLEQNMVDNLKQLIKITVQIMVRAEMEVFRQQFDEKLQFNGNYFRQMFSTFGKVSDIPIPRFRTSLDRAELRTMDVFDKEKERFTALIGQMHLMGISQRKIKQLTRLCLGTNISTNRVGTIYKELADSEEMNINSQPLDDNFEYLLLDGIWEKTKGYGWDNNRTTLLCVLGVRPNGERKVLGFTLSRAEDIESWKKLLLGIKRRGLKGNNLKLIITDDHSSIKVAVDSIYPHTPIQLCVVHKIRNVLGKTTHKNKVAMAEDLKIIFKSTTRDEAIKKAKHTVRKWYVAEAKATESLRHNIEYCFTYMQFPRNLWSKIRTTNILEREFREVRRRIKVFDNTFQSDESAHRYANTIFTNLNNNYPLKSTLHTKS